jgi:micrococcal nuclease
MRIAAPYRRLRRHRRVSPGAMLVLLAILGGVGYLALANSGATSSNSHQNVKSIWKSERFAACGYLSRTNCVIDGDTFLLDGEKIRIADIDAPETGGAQCGAEAELGARATRRLRDLLNEGPFELRNYESRDRDRYGRKLRIVVRNGTSIGDRLVAEGLARRWTGRRMPWCA